MHSPFLDTTSVQNPAAEPPDETLVALAQTGDSEALDRLLTRHQPWVYNLMLRLLANCADAEDATQEALLRAFQGLGAFRGESRFRTWLYRIAVNHALNRKKGAWAAADSVCSFENAARGLAQVPDLDPPDPRTVPVPVEILIEEAKIGCMMGTLLCLDGRQRLVFTLGVIFGASDVVGAEIAGVTAENFRQILSRARRDLYEYLRGNCSLVNPGAACKCARKTSAFIRGGFVDPQARRFTAGYQRLVREQVDARASELVDAYEQVGEDVYRGHPFYEPAEQVEKLRAALVGTFPELSQGASEVV